MRHALLEQALAAQQQGDLELSKNCFIGYLKEIPEDAQAWYLLGMVYQQQQNYLESIKQILKAIDLNPDSAQYLLSLGLSYDKNGQFELAEEAYCLAEKMRPDVFQVHFDFGCFMRNHRRYQEAVKYFKKTIELNATHYPSYTNLSSALQELGDLEQAEIISRKINNLVPDNPQLMLNLAQVLIEKEAYSEAMSLLERAISIDNNYLAAQITYGKLNYLVNNKNKAKEIFDNILKLEPHNYKVQALLAKCLIDDEQFELAQVLLEKSLKVSPDYLGSILAKAELLSEKGQFEDSVAVYLKGIEGHSDSVELYYGLGILYSQQGNFDSSNQYFIKALKLNNTYTQALHAITKTTDYQTLDHYEVKLAIELNQKIKSNPNALTTKQKIDLYFSLGKIFDDIKQVDDAFEYYQLGNQLRYDANPYEIAEFIKFNDASNKTFKKVNNINEFNIQNSHPIFIVGMPRSGTTLLEQILSSHSDVLGAGELTEIQKISKNINQYPDFEISSSSINVQALRSKYQAKMKTIKGSELTKWMVDKNPINYRHIGLIKLILPEAKIIHMQRHPLDSILSIYFQRLSEAHKYAFNLQALAQYYTKYQELMSFWGRQYSTDIIPCRYDDLVSNTEQSVTTILNRIGLDWQQSCAEFHNNNRKVSTASSWQVRQPIFNSSVERWKQYRHHLEPIEDKLSDAIQNWNNGAS